MRDDALREWHVTIHHPVIDGSVSFSIIATSLSRGGRKSLRDERFTRGIARLRTGPALARAQLYYIAEVDHSSRSVEWREPTAATTPNSLGTHGDRATLTLSVVLELPARKFLKNP